MPIHYRRINWYEYQQGFPPELWRSARGTVFVDKAALMALWRSADERTLDGTALYDLVSAFKARGEVTWTGRGWAFASVAALEEFLRMARAHMATVVPWAPNDPSAPIVEAIRIGGHWVAVTVRNPPPDPRAKKLVLEQSRLFAESSDGTRHVAIMTMEELGAAVSRAGLRDEDIAWIRGAERPIPPVAPVRTPAGAVTVDIDAHPLALRILIIAGQLPPEARFGQEPPPHPGIMCLSGDAWKSLESRLLEAGIPVAEVAETPGFDLAPGWDSPGAGGEALYEYQRRGVEFLARRGLRALLADEMGLGKTAQAIRAAAGCGVRRAVVVAPAIARYVWDAEIRRWRPGAKVQHVEDTSSLEIDPKTEWLIASYDQLSQRQATVALDAPPAAVYRALTGGELPLAADAEQKLLEAGRPHLAGVKITPRAVCLKLRAAIALKRPDALPGEARAKLERANARLRGAVLQAIAAWSPDLVVLDEAHKVKNREAKRTRAVEELLAAMPERRVIAMTGTPMRNRPEEIRQILELIDPSTVSKLPNDLWTLRSCLEWVMLRRRKAEVMDQLPAVIRQTVEVDLRDGLDEYYDTMRAAEDVYREAYLRARRHGASEAQAVAQARQCVLGLLSHARCLLGVRKASDPRVAELIADAAEAGMRPAVFCHHRDVFAVLQRHLEALGVRCFVLTGDVTGAARADAMRRFNECRDGMVAFMGGITIMESISLSDVGMYFLLEFPWVPAEILQAEARLIRPARDLAARVSVHAIQLVARIAEPNLDAYMQRVLNAKLAVIGHVLNDQTLPLALKSVQSDAIDWLLNQSASVADADFGARAACE